MTVLGLVSAVSGFVKVRYLIDKAIIDNLVFRCHYRITSALLFVCCIIVTANNLIGKTSNMVSWQNWKYANEMFLFTFRWSHILYQWRSCSRTCDKYLLLDYPHIHDAWPAWQACGHGSCPERTRKWQCREDIPQLLSVGAIRAFLPGKLYNKSCLVRM